MRLTFHFTFHLFTFHLFALTALNSLSANTNPNNTQELDNSNQSTVISKLQEYIQIKTAHPTPDYAKSTEFLVNYAKELDIQSQVIEYVKGKPLVIMTLKGKDPQLPSVLLNSHTDVVPVSLPNWKWDPFSGELTKDDQGKEIIVGRGTQDVKGVGICYLEAIRALKKKDFQPLRTIHISFSPDEELGGIDGMRQFVETEAFKKLNVGFSLDEGVTTPLNEYKVYYGERVRWAINVTAVGDTGHASTFVKNLAFEKFNKFYKHLDKFRSEEEERLDSGKVANIGEVTTINLTILKAGDATNTVPDTVNAYFDIRVSPRTDLVKFKNDLSKWANTTDVKFFFVDGTPEHAITDYKNSVWWKAFTDSAQTHNVTLSPEIFVGASDGRFLRMKNIPVLGINAFRSNPFLAHDHNEYLRLEALADGLNFYKILIPQLANAN